MYTKRDFLFSIITGSATGLIVAFIFRHLGLSLVLAGFEFSGNIWFGLVLILPVLWVLGTYILGYKLSRYISLLFQFSKFAATGFLNTAIDFGLINLLVFSTDITKGVGIIGINTVAFTAATVNSYYWNKYWTFGEKGGAKFTQFFQFLVISIIGILINDGVVFAVTTFIEPVYGLSPVAWVNVAKIAASATALLWNFIGYKLIVFKKAEELPMG